MINYHVIKVLVALIAIVAFTSCYEEKKREVISDRYSSGRKKIVNVYKGSGSDESLFEKRLYMHNGFLLMKKRLSEPYNEYPKHKKTFGAIHLRDGKVNLKKYIEGTWVSEHTVEISGDIVAIEKHTMNVSNSYVLRNIEVKGCADNEYELTYASRFEIEHLGRDKNSYFVNVEEVEREMENGMNLEDWLNFIESYEEIHGDDFETTLYLRRLAMNTEVSDTKVDAILPRYIPGEYEEYIEDPGSGTLSVLRSDKGYDRYEYKSDTDSFCLSITCKTDFGDTYYGLFVPKEAYKESKCEV
jgi:hypothetical protein